MLLQWVVTHFQEKGQKETKQEKIELSTSKLWIKNFNVKTIAKIRTFMILKWVNNESGF